MGGIGSGGARVGAGRKSKRADQHWLGGDAGKRGRGDKPKAPPPVEVIAAPWDLEEPVKGVWEAMAPHACEARTLTKATVFDFRELCELVVDMRAARAARRAAGWDADGCALNTQYRGLVQRVEAKMRAFRLAPIGKEMAPEAAKPADPWAEFESPGGVQ